jgi:hypothetical protein
MKKTIAIAAAVLLLAGAHTLSAQMTISNGQQTTTTQGVSPQPGMPAGNETPPAGFVKSVTPVSGCLDQLPPEEAAEVRARYLKPYQECQRRLQIHAIKRAKAGKESESEKQTQAESPRNFVRVQKDTAPAAEPVLGIRGSNIPDIKEKTPGNYNR